ncbi:unnamed protein product [Clavelina lepadiformis]|uniref:Secreted protein n=1 Tax=Clavelina lepadiformis TaxID=159417 RepID=A0ABP0F6F2_CLALP
MSFSTTSVGTLTWGLLASSFPTSKRRNRMSSRNLSLAMVWENIGHPHDLPHKLFTGKLRPPITPRATTKPTNLSNSSNLSN